MARLDRLGGAREVAQIAAVIGRQFAFALLEAVTAKDAGELEAAGKADGRGDCVPRGARSRAELQLQARAGA